jgi:hypothetical protein
MAVIGGLMFWLLAFGFAGCAQINLAPIGSNILFVHAHRCGGFRLLSVPSGHEITGFAT